MGFTPNHPTIEVKAQILRGAEPFYATQLASGADLSAAIDSPIELLVGQRILVPTGLVLEIPCGYEAQVRSRSGLTIKHGVVCLNSPGTIDADYRGEIQVILANLGTMNFMVQPGTRIAQLVFAPVVQAQFVASSPGSTERGSGGFGSTGMNTQ